MRLFVAVDIPENVRGAVRLLDEKLRHACPSARWARVEGLHVTLKFIGETSPEVTEKIKTALASVAFPAPISMNFHGLGFFPNEHRPRVLWIGIEAGPELAALAGSIEAALEPLKIPREHRAFAPHLTLARFDSPRDLRKLRTAIEAAAHPEFGNATAKVFHLYQSVLKRGGAEYTRVATFSCAGSRSE